MNIKEKLHELLLLARPRKVDWRVLAGLGLAGLAVIGVTSWLMLEDYRNNKALTQAFSEGQSAVTQVGESVQALQRVLQDEKVQALAASAVGNPDGLKDLESYLSGRMSEVSSVQVFTKWLESLDPNILGPNGYAILDMLHKVLAGKNPNLQLHGTAKPPMMFIAARVMKEDELVAFLVLGVNPDYILSRFNPGISELGFVRLTQYNGRQPATTLKEAGEAARLGEIPDRLPVPGTLFRIEIPQQLHAGFLSGSLGIILLAMGFVLLGLSALLYRLAPRESETELRPESLDRPEILVVQDDETPTASNVAMIEKDELAVEGDGDGDSDSDGGEEAKPPPQLANEPEPPRMHLRYDVVERRRMKREEHSPVELLPEIFRAYDIRGVVYKTLDAGVTTQIGQAVGTMALEKGAGPVVVARDGRLSGPELAEGMIEGIVSTGCDALDIGAVPTGVLYYAAHEFAKGTGVMITGSHNPPDYNGVKIMLAGDTLSGDQIFGIYERIKEGDIRVGRGEVTEQDVVPQYIERIASDIQLEKPLRVVIDCGNGIGGVCAADVLRAIGAEALALFDEVDGTFPNHHPDPSDPENLKDLIESVRLMDADLGLALDGDADRLGVVTLGGSIIYADRIMMLLAMDVLDRKPGATIIYDVKCTNHLAQVIKEAGGNPVMYKTGHSLIKTRMKEIDSPFAGEMSGHFFFGERWYGVDDGIYAAARLLEILAGAEAPPEAILNALPTSFSTPELKVQMLEGQNHAFIEIFQQKARFDGASINTIDGLRADFHDGWGLVRPSNTTPILVCRFDAETEEALERIKVAFRSQMLQINPGLELPF